MSYRSMLKHRCEIWTIGEAEEEGQPVLGWAPLRNPDGTPRLFRCFLDLTFIRKGRDPMWTPEAGRPSDRTGVWFGLADTPLRSGDRIKMVKGPQGVFKTEGAFDEAWTPEANHHLEVGVVEVAAQLSRPQFSQVEDTDLEGLAAALDGDDGR